MERRLRHLVTALAPCAGAALILATGLGAADGSACPSPEVTAPVAGQRAAMVCLVNELRDGRGLRELRRSARLDRAARLKASAIARCEDFSHTPCGRTFASTFITAGYAVGSWTVGENLAWGAGERGSVARIFALLLDSPTHLRNFVRRGWRDIGVAVWQGALFGHEDVSVWVVDFGSRP
jgi:uncharacterized protein YkwD